MKSHPPFMFTRGAICATFCGWEDAANDADAGESTSPTCHGGARSGASCRRSLRLEGGENCSSSLSPSALRSAQNSN